MMKVRATIGYKPVVILDLSWANLDQLRQDGLGAAIKIDGNQLGLGADVWITAAATEQQMMDLFAAGVGPETVLHIDKRFKS
jgi:hypothetical protein